MYNLNTKTYFALRDIDKVDATMDDIRDQMDVANEISEAISRPVGMGDELDEVTVFMAFYKALNIYIYTYN